MNKKEISGCGRGVVEVFSLLGAAQSLVHDLLLKIYPRNTPFSKESEVLLRCLNKVEFKNSALLGCYAARNGNSLPPFRDNLSVPFSWVGNPRIKDS